MATSEQQSSRPVAIPVVLGALVPPAIQFVFDALPIWGSPGDDRTPLVLLTYGTSAAIGFFLMTRRCTFGERLAIALGYFPVMFCVLFVESLGFAGRFYHQSL